MDESCVVEEGIINCFKKWSYVTFNDLYHSYKKYDKILNKKISNKSRFMIKKRPYVTLMDL